MADRDDGKEDTPTKKKSSRKPIVICHSFPELENLPRAVARAPCNLSVAQSPINDQSLDPKPSNQPQNPGKSSEVKLPKGNGVTESQKEEPKQNENESPILTPNTRRKLATVKHPPLKIPSGLPSDSSSLPHTGTAISVDNNADSVVKSGKCDPIDKDANITHSPTKPQDHAAVSRRDSYTVLGHLGHKFSVTTPVKEVSVNPFVFSDPSTAAAKNEKVFFEGGLIESSTDNSKDKQISETAKNLPPQPLKDFNRPLLPFSKSRFKERKGSLDASMFQGRRFYMPDRGMRNIFKSGKHASSVAEDSAENDLNKAPIWHKKLSQLFIPPSQEELGILESPTDETTAFLPQSPTPRIVPTSEGVSSKAKRTSKVKRKSSNSSVDDKDRLEILDSLVENDNFSDSTTSSSASSSDEATQKNRTERKPSEEKPLTKAEEAKKISEKEEDDHHSTYNDTICSNRSSYFKQIYLHQKFDDAKPSKISYGNTSMASLIKENKPDKAPKDKKKKKEDYCNAIITFVLFVVILVFVSVVYHYYHLYIQNLYIFNRIEIVEANRTMEVLSLDEYKVPLVKIRLGVNIPIKNEYTDCTKYLWYLYDEEGAIDKFPNQKKRRSAGDEPNFNRNRLKQTSTLDESLENARIQFERPNQKHGKRRNHKNSDGTRVNPKFARKNLRADSVPPHETYSNEVTEYDYDKIIYDDVVDICGVSYPGDISSLDFFSDMHCIYYKNMARLQLTHRPPLQNVDCFSVHWESNGYDLSMKDCFQMDNAQTGVWWGLGDVTGGSIPLTKIGKLSDVPMYSGEIQKNFIGSLIRRTFISSNGVMVTVPSASKATFSVNAESNGGEFCLTSQPSLSSYHKDGEDKPELDYTVCTGPSTKDLLRSLHDVECMNEVEYSTSRWHRNFYTLPSGVELYKPLPIINSTVVDAVTDRFKCPMWRPWLSHDEDKIEQADVIGYAESIASTIPNPCGHVLLPTSWQHKVGQLDFDKLRFPDPNTLKEALLTKGLYLALTISPLIDTSTDRFKESTLNEFLLKQINSTLPILVNTAEGGTAGVLDFTNPNTADWFQQQIQILVDKYGIDRFHLAAVPSLSLPPFRQQNANNMNPDFSFGRFARTVARVRPPLSTDGDLIPPDPPTFITTGSGDASWDMLKMLPNRIMSISAVGGNIIDSGVVGGWSSQKGYIPEKELYVRWLQLSTFMPAMQMSVLPSMYDENIQKNYEKLVELRKELVLPRLEKDLKENLENGYPLINSLAIIFPKDPKSLKIGDQWMVGDDLLVAPVLRRGKKSRDIYLPPGLWKDPNFDRLLRGKRWMKNYSALLNKVPYFQLITPQGRDKKKKSRKSG